MDWNAFRRGMEAARSSGEPAAQATLAEVSKWGGPDFSSQKASDEPSDWHLGFDHAVRLARRPQK